MLEKIFKHSKYMIIYKIVNSWKFDSFPNCSILKICYCSKLKNFRNLMFFEIEKFWNFARILEFSQLKIFWILQIEHFWNFSKWKFLKISKLNFLLNLPNWKFFEFSNIKVFGIVQIQKSRNFWKIMNWI